MILRYMQLLFLNCRFIAGSFRFLLPLPLVMSLSACIVFPVDMGEEELFKDKHLAFIEIGKTTKLEIEEGIAAAERKEEITLAREMFREGDWWLYSQTREEAKWVIIAENPDSFGGVDYRFLLIKFDDNEVVAEYELSSSETLGCNQRGVCLGQSGYSLLSPEEEDRAVKQIDIPADRCGVYAYGRRSFLFYPWSEFSVWLDGEQIGWFVDNKQFLFWQIDQGPHQLVTRSVIYRNQEQVEKQVNFYCGGGDLYFFEVVARAKGFSSNWWIEIDQQSPIDGRNNISKRRLILTGCDSTETLSIACK